MVIFLNSYLYTLSNDCYNARERDGAHISNSSHKPLQNRLAGHPRVTSVWPVAYLRSTSHLELRENDVELATAPAQNQN
jgi:hypothetical protein